MANNQIFDIIIGQVTCCYTNGCNKDIDTALGSYQSQDVASPAQAFKVQSLLQVDIHNKGLWESTI